MSTIACTWGNRDFFITQYTFENCRLGAISKKHNALLQNCIKNAIPREGVMRSVLFSAKLLVTIGSYEHYIHVHQETFL
ncbi:hypothetical protein OTSANNIE_0946 [Anaplasma phagocytophilum str. Annie]|uniref:Uncharacterized protein n=1 Tax=Anaplasma phagocytophilum str. NCH-1 TaxID=1359161 RepID=A0A0F3N9H2_ANAPH|nr:hypothetical protein EPHNCH_0988 [Anaplasma phagocytophilum str. NCH-1]KJV82658.1 hypothetical protein APHHGE2_0975 [Anaplasma phagocytophilum str. HGE2]KJV87359.1 hypothetical protein APHNYW_0685 [Anaplasma phagocytophilum str. ApNYW]KJV98793.1 hypothetical protein OTSANNIE_0946 [Anaplasma phagocytophilum str. Annie]